MKKDIIDLFPHSNSPHIVTAYCNCLTLTLTGMCCPFSSRLVFNRAHGRDRDDYDQLPCANRYEYTHHISFSRHLVPSPSLSPYLSLPSLICRPLSGRGSDGEAGWVSWDQDHRSGSGAAGHSPFHKRASVATDRADPRQSDGSAGALEEAEMLGRPLHGRSVQVVDRARRVHGAGCTVLTETDVTERPMKRPL